MADYQPLQEQAYQHLRRLILTGGLQPGVVYSETRMAKEIGVSRTPMKDALVRLQQNHFIDILPSRGFQLHLMDQHDIWDTYQVRTAVEGFCAAHLAHQPPSQRAVWLRRLRDTLSEMERLSGDRDIQPFQEVDLRFHQLLVDSCENRQFSQLFESYYHQIALIALDSLVESQRVQVTLDEHRAILRAIEASASPADMAPLAAVRTHMESSRDITLRHLACAP